MFLDVGDGIADFIPDFVQFGQIRVVFGELRPKFHVEKGAPFDVELALFQVVVEGHFAHDVEGALVVVLAFRYLILNYHFVAENDELRVERRSVLLGN